jgi:AraC-like DNA-binding protein
MYLSINIVRGVVDELVHEGYSIDQVCAETGLSPSELADANFRLPLPRSNQVIGAACRMARAPALGLRVGAKTPMGALHVVGHILMSCATMREAIEMFRRYSALVFEGGGFSLVETGDEGRFVYEHPFAGSRYERFAAEVSLTVALRMGVKLSGSDKVPRLVRFRHERPDYATEYERVYGCPVSFGAPANEIVFARRLLDLPQLHRDELLCELLRERADQLLADTQATERLAERIVEGVKLQLALGPSGAAGGAERSDVMGGADPTQVAQRLGMTLRSLQRRLQASSLSLSRLIDEARREVACASLRRRDTPIKDIAHRLGFSEPSAFHRAFKRWTGTTPLSYRAEQLRELQRSE